MCVLLIWKNSKLFGFIKQFFWINYLFYHIEVLNIREKQSLVFVNILVGKYTLITFDFNGAYIVFFSEDAE
jgi:hypothetical protein